MKKTILTSVLMAFGFLINQVVAQLPTYELTARNIAYVSPSVLEFDIYMLHTNPSVTPFQYSTGQYYLDYNPAMLNSGAVVSGTLLASDLPVTHRPGNPNIGATQAGGLAIRMSANVPSAGPFISSTGLGTRIGKVRLTVTNGTYNTNQAPNLTWRNGPGNPFTKISALVNGSAVSVTTPATHIISNPYVLNLTALIEGRYDGTVMVADTVTACLYHSTTHTLIESVKGVLDQDGHATFNFDQASNSTAYYVVIKHKNSIETWSANTLSFSGNQMTYDFTAAKTRAYGDNLKLVGSKWCIYTGDVSRDGSVDLDDLLTVFNAAVNYVNGPNTLTDLDGDDWVDASDLSIVDNNNYSFIMVKKP